MPTRASQLRSNSTDAERHLWQCLRNRQHPLPPHTVDFVCLERRLIVELDGGQHAEALTCDARSQHLQQSGYVVLRFWNDETLGNTESMLTTILQQLHEQPEAST